MRIVDSHAHLEFPQFDNDREAMLDRARAASITTLLAIGHCGSASLASESPEGATESCYGLNVAPRASARHRRGWNQKLRAQALLGVRWLATALVNEVFSSPGGRRR